MEAETLSGTVLCTSEGYVSGYSTHQVNWHQVDLPAGSGCDLSPARIVCEAILCEKAGGQSFSSDCAGFPVVLKRSEVL